MKIGIIGATGHAGSALVEEAQARGHQVTAIVRNREKALEMLGDQVTILEKDALTLELADLKDLDYVVDAFASFTAHENLDLATRLVALLRDQPTPGIVFILGASSLKQENGETMLDTILKTSADQPWIQTPIQQVHEYEFLKWVDNVNWTAVSPQAEFVPGPKSNYKIGKDNIMTNVAGKSTVTTGNVASAILDEIEHPVHQHSRFTVVDQ